MYRFINHTADIGFSIEADSRQNLFKDALSAVIEVLTGVKSSRSSRGDGTGKAQSLHITAEGHDDEELLVSLLNEFLFHCVHEMWLPYAVNRISFPECNIVAAAVDALPNHDPREFVHDVKSATYHGLEVKSTTKWTATIILDV